MERTIWNGTLEFGKVVIPVGLATAVRDYETGLRKIHKRKRCQTPINLRPYCPHDEKLLEPEEIVSAFEISPGGGYQPVTTDALSDLKEPDTRRIPIGFFTATAAIDPRLVKKHYHLVPSSPIGLDAYALLVAVLAEHQVAGITRFAWKGEKIAALASHDGILDLAILHPLDDLVVEDTWKLAAEIGVDLESRTITGELLDLTRQLVAQHTRTLKPNDLASRERARLTKLREQLLAGEPIVRPAMKKNQQPAAPTADLEAVLRRSIKTPAATR